MSLLIFLNDQHCKLNSAYSTLFDNVKYNHSLLLSKFSIETSTEDIIQTHKLKSKLLDILSSMKDLEDEMIKFNDLLNGVSNPDCYVEDNKINKTISDLTPFLFLYYMNIKDKDNKNNKNNNINQRSSVADEVD